MITIITKILIRELSFKEESEHERHRKNFRFQNQSNIFFEEILLKF